MFDVDKRVIGSILLIVGASVGAAILVLPVISAREGFLTAVILLFSCWLITTLGALLILEVNLWFPEGSNIIFMAKSTLGSIGQIIAWCVYLLLLYSLICAFISSLSDVLYALLLTINLNVKQWLVTTAIVMVFGFIVGNGVRAVDVCNKNLVTLKFIIYILLVFSAFSHIKISRLMVGSLDIHISTITIMVTSFSFSTIVPSLRVYLKGDTRKLKFAILVGSFIVLVLYIVWFIAVYGTVKRTGLNGLIHIAYSSHVTSTLIATFGNQVHYFSLPILIYLFANLCIATSFLGASLCLSDFLSDGLQLRKKNGGYVAACLCAFIPPFVIVLFAPDIFVSALKYAGFCCIILSILMPVLMVWSGRYGKNRCEVKKNVYQVWGGKYLLLLAAVFAVTLIVWNVALL
jgi:tyrosine-specific transport protein